MGTQGHSRRDAMWLPKHVAGPVGSRHLPLFGSSSLVTKLGMSWPWLRAQVLHGKCFLRALHEVMNWNWVSSQRSVSTGPRRCFAHTEPQLSSTRSAAMTSSRGFRCTPALPPAAGGVESLTQGQMRVVRGCFARQRGRISVTRHCGFEPMSHDCMFGMSSPHSCVHP